MKKLLVLFLFALIGCSKSNPTGPVVEHGDVGLDRIHYHANTHTVTATRYFGIWVEAVVRLYEPGYITKDSCRLWVYLDNGKVLTNLPTNRSIFPVQPNPAFQLIEFDFHDNTEYAYPHVVTLSDSLARPDSVIARVTYSTNVGTRQKVFKVTPADTIYYYNFIQNP